MNSIPFRWPLLLALAAFTDLACSSTPEGKTQVAAAVQSGTPGGVYVRTFKTKATVTAIDVPARKVTLVSTRGTTATFTAGPEVANFNQIRVGDHIKASVTEKLVIFMATNAPPQGEGQAALVALAPAGAKPGAFLANTVQVKAKVTKIHARKHEATLQFPDGSKETFRVRDDVDLSQRHVGEVVVIRATQALAISVEEPAIKSSEVSK